MSEVEKPEENLVTLKELRPGADLRGRTLDGLAPKGIPLHGIKLEGAAVKLCDFTGANLSGSSCARMEWHTNQAVGIYFQNADLRGATLGGGLSRADFRGADLRGTNLKNANLEGSEWGEARVDRFTKLPTDWGRNHDHGADGGSHVTAGRFNWERIRFIADTPIFAGSWLLATLSAMVVLAVGFANEPEVLDFLGQLPMPRRLFFLLPGSFLTVVGSTLVQFRCPSIVKEFTRTKWINELKKPGQVYAVQSDKRPTSAATAMVTLGAGGLILVSVFLERVAAALAILWL